MPSQRAGIDALGARDVVFLQIFIKRHLAAPVAWCFAELFDDESAHVRLAALLVERVDSVVPDQRISHRHDLASIRWVGQDFLVAGHRGVEANLADSGAGCGKRFALEVFTVLESKQRAHRGRLSMLTREFQTPRAEKMPESK